MNELRDFLYRLLGRNVRDVNTGFRGTVIAYTYYRNGREPEILISGLDSGGCPFYDWVNFKDAEFDEG